MVFHELVEGEEGSIEARHDHNEEQRVGQLKPAKYVKRDLEELK